MEPGEGAIEYAQSITVGLTREQAALVLRNLEKQADPRVKRCETCGYYFRDKTKPNNARVCSQRTCKTVRKSAQRWAQRGRGRPRTAKPIVYAWWLEYPYWLSERIMLSRAWSYERPRDPDKLAQIMAAKQRSETMGGHKRI